MKRIVLTILITSLLISLFTGCGNRIVVNEKLSGRSDHWAVTYEIKGRVYTRIDRDGNEQLTSFGKWKYEVKYVGNMEDLRATTDWGADGTPLIRFANGLGVTKKTSSNLVKPIYYKKPPSSGARGGISTDSLMFIHNNDLPQITIYWNGDNGGEEIIYLR